MNKIQVPFFRPNLGEREVEEVVETLRSGWLTTDPQVCRLEQGFAAGMGCSVHWRQLYLHPYRQQTCDWRSQDLPVASVLRERLVRLPLFPRMREEEWEHVVETVRRLCSVWARKGPGERRAHPQRGCLQPPPGGLQPAARSEEAF
jgi:dTDP-4-amino-4,6-dideoxygalactose transaminase